MKNYDNQHYSKYSPSTQPKSNLNSNLSRVGQNKSGGGSNISGMDNKQMANQLRDLNNQLEKKDMELKQQQNSNNNIMQNKQNLLSQQPHDQNNQEYLGNEQKSSNIRGNIFSSDKLSSNSNQQHFHNQNSKLPSSSSSGVHQKQYTNNLFGNQSSSSYHRDSHNNRSSHQASRMDNRSSNQQQIPSYLNKPKTATTDKSIDQKQQKLLISDPVEEIKLLTEKLDSYRKKCDLQQKEIDRLRPYEFKYYEMKKKLQIYEKIQVDLGKDSQKPQIINGSDGGMIKSSVLQQQKTIEEEKEQNRNAPQLSRKQTIPSQNSKVVSHLDKYQIKPKTSQHTSQPISHSGIVKNDLKSKKSQEEIDQEKLSLMIALQFEEEERKKAKKMKQRHEFFMNEMHMAAAHGGRMDGPGHGLEISIQEQMQIQRAIEESKKDNAGGINPDNMTYEEMLALGEKLGKVNKGFPIELVNLIPKKQFTEYMDSNGEPANCPICFENYKNEDFTKELSCLHNFHDACIDKWLQDEKRCPVCNKEVEIF
eukprot:403358214